MKYFKQYKGESDKIEITKEEARHTLDGWWKEKCLNDIFDNEKGFRLYTAYAIVWTETDDGKVPMAGFFGTVG